VTETGVKGDAELRDVLAELETLMGSLRVNVDTLQAILTEPEVPVDEP
jgi:hypothetical protein